MGVVGLVACADYASLEGRPCPCATAYTCCELTNLCVQDPTTCELEVTPKQIKLRLGAKQEFSASISVTWTVDEPGGGAITPNGEYKAPLKPGTYHVRARTPSGTSSSATVLVGPTKLSLRLGSPGGKGTADGVGSDARFSALGSITRDGEFLYVVDGEAGSHGVRRISTTTREVKWIARGTVPQLDHIAAADGELFAISQYPPRKILRIDLGTGAATTLATEGKMVDGEDLGKIWELVADGAGKLYFTQVVEASNAPGIASAIRRFDVATGKVTTLVAGSGWSGAALSAAPLGAVTRLALSDGFLYAADGTSVAPWQGGPQSVQTIWKHDLETGTTEALQSKPFLDNLGIQALCVDATGLPLGILDSFGWGSCATPILLDDTGCQGFGVFTQQVACAGDWSSPSRRVYFTDPERAVVMSYAPVGPTVLAGHPQPASSGEAERAGPYMLLRGPHALSADAKGNIVLIDGLDDAEWSLKGEPARFVRIGADGTLVEYPMASACAPYIADFGTPREHTRLAPGPDGSVYYLTHTSALALAAIDVQTGQCEVKTELPGLDWSSMDLVNEGAAFYTSQCWPKPKVVRFTASGVIETVLDGHCGALASSGTHQLFIAEPAPVEDSSGGHVLRLDLDTREVQELATPADGWAATSLVYDPAGLLYVAEVSRQRVRALIVETGEIFDVLGKQGNAGVQLGALPASLSRPVDMALLPDGSLVLSDFGENVLLVAE